MANQPAWYLPGKNLVFAGRPAHGARVWKTPGKRQPDWKTPGVW